MISKPTIKYKIGGSFETVDKQSRGICFEVFFPGNYNNYEEAEEKAKHMKLWLCKNTGEYWLMLKEKEEVRDIIREDEWWKYHVAILKKESISNYCVDAYHDYEPCRENFGQIFSSIIGQGMERELCCLAHWIAPVLEMKNDGSYTYRKQKYPFHVVEA